MTDSTRLAANIGKDETNQALTLIRSAGQSVLEIQDADKHIDEIQKEVTRSSCEGLVLLGGYDVLPSQRLDALDPDLRRAIGSEAGRDADNFIVWSDEVYGDLNGDSLAEIPISRIPDSKSSRLVFTSLTAKNGSGDTRFGIRNEARKFADGIYTLLKGNGNLLISRPTSPELVGPAKVLETGIYFMLHGSDGDGSRFWGEEDGSMFEAVNVSNLGAVLPSVVFTGCCWGALTVDKIASRSRAGEAIPVRTVESSMALTFLLAGARGFVGCTGSHYSPLQAPFQFYGGPMHASFWKRYNGSGSPASALHLAKKDFLDGIPHNRTTDVGHAIELKILREYTCLGLGW